MRSQVINLKEPRSIPLKFWLLLLNLVGSNLQNDKLCAQLFPNSQQIIIKAENLGYNKQK